MSKHYGQHKSYYIDILKKACNNDSNIPSISSLPISFWEGMSEVVSQKELERLIKLNIFGASQYSNKHTDGQSDRLPSENAVSASIMIFYGTGRKKMANKKKRMDNIWGSE